MVPTHSIPIEPYEVEYAATVVHVINVHDFETVKNNNSTPLAKNSAKSMPLLTLLCSVALHMLAFWALNLSIQLLTFSDKPEAPDIIKATLYKSPESTNRNEQPEVSPSDAVTRPNIENLVVLDKHSSLPNTNEIESLKPAEEQTTQPETLTEDKQRPSPKVLNATSPKSLYSTKAANDLKVLEEQQQDSLSKQAFKDFQYNTAHPEIKTGSIDNRSANARLKDSVTITVDCKKVTSKALRIVNYLTYYNFAQESGQKTYAHGTVVCHKHGDINPFIQKRVHSKQRKKDMANRGN